MSTGYPSNILSSPKRLSPMRRVSGASAQGGLGSLLTLEEVTNLKEVWEGFLLMEKYQVPKDNCQCLQDIKDRLRLHYQKQHGQGRSPEAAQEVIQMLRKDDESKRLELKKIYEEVRKTLDCLDDHVINHLISEGTIHGDLQSDLNKQIQLLKSNECPILVAGETSSGKSSLLNLLLGQEILPHRLLSCTSVICRIRYGPTLRAKIIKDDESYEEMLLNPDANPVQQLSRYIYKEGPRNQAMPYKIVEIYLPLEILKTGIYIIDSPGFGENAGMDQLLLEYIATNQIFAFIYVIKSDNAGGVQEDRLQKILKHIAEKQQRDLYGSFNPRAAMFVCNRWDLVPGPEKETVLKDTIRKLSRSWPNMDKSQVFCLSTTKAWNTKMAGYAAEDFSELLDGIQRLVPVGLQRKIQLSYKWAEHLLQRVRHHVNGYLAKTRISAQELQARQKATELRLHKVEKESDVIMKRLEKQLDKNVRTISAKLSQYLQTEGAKLRITCWAEDQLPRVEEDDVWPDVEADLDCLIEKRLSDILREWDEKTQMFQQVQQELLRAFKEEFLVLDSQLSTVENFIQSDELSLSDMSDEDTSRLMSITDPVDTTNGFWNFNLNSLEKVAMGVAAPVLVPMAVGMLLGAPILLLWDFKKWRRRSIAQKNLENYLEDPVYFVRTRAAQTLDKVSDIEIVSEYVYNQLEPARQYLESMRAAIPKLVESNRSLIEAIVKDKRTGAELESHYLGLEKTVPELQEKVARFNNLYIRDYDFKKEDVEILTPTTSSMTKRNSRKSIWSEVKPAKIMLNNKEQSVSVKLYTHKVSQMHLATEEVHLRRVKHPNVVKFLGTFEVARGMPAFVLEPCTVRARQELFGYKGIPRRSKGKNMFLERCRRFMEQVGMGLEYMHCKGLIHMELSLDTVMLVTSSDQAKLINLGEPRLAVLPYPQDASVAECVYLPPEVLRGAIYRLRGDMYGLGLMAWELWNQELAFKRQRDTRLDHFLQTLRPSLLKGDEDNPFDDLIRRCVHVPAEQRMTSTEWVNDIRKIDLTKEVTEDDEASVSSK